MNVLRPHLGHGRRLIEPFMGSGAIFLNTSFPEYYLAEQNRDLIDLYRHLSKYGTDFINECKQLFVPELNNSDNYYQIREEFNQSPPSRRRSALFLYLNRHGYNGLCRYNNAGKFNVPFGRYTKPYFPSKEMTAFHQRSSIVEFIHADFRDTLKIAKKSDVIYCDPPYEPLTESANFTQYTGRGFGENEQIQLAETARALANKGCRVVISNHDNPKTRDYYQHARIESLQVQRHVSCKGRQRQVVNELIAIFDGSDQLSNG